MRLTIKLKLAATFVGLVLLLAASTAFGLLQMNRMNQGETAMIKGPATQLQRAQTVASDLLQIVRAEKDMVLSSNAAETQAQNGPKCRLISSAWPLRVTIPSLTVSSCTR